MVTTLFPDENIEANPMSFEMYERDGVLWVGYVPESILLVD